MHKKIYLSILLLTVCLFIGFSNISVQAKKNYIHKFPKSLKGTWYSYDKDVDGNNKMYKLAINEKNFRFHPYKKHRVFIGCQPPKTKHEKSLYKKTEKWLYGISFKQKGHEWIKFYGWQQQAGCGQNYNVRMINGHKVLSIGDGAGNWICGHYYQSKKLALKMGTRHYHGFKYYPAIE
ncbi:hypothetical protein [Apilactobacillus xinyiensis]|uniref:hypothetical protein n=1 Tax=Apilactobacillus xinyiensis TaxID=2841032 RepID=UPI001C7E1442|nr:hypothetical protein [Apilactobacillus xinyiensis]